MTDDESTASDRAARTLAPYNDDEIALLDEVWGSCADDVYVHDADGRYRYVNEPALRHLGLSRELMLGRTWREIGLPEKATAAFERVRQSVIATGEAAAADTVYPTTDGLLCFQYTVSPIFDADGYVVGTLSVVRDATERMMTERALADSETRYRTLYENMTQGVVYQNREFEIVAANDAAHRILGLSHYRISGKTSMDPIWHAIREDGTEFPGEQHASVIAMSTGEPVANVVMGIKTPSFSDYHWLRIAAFPLFHPGESEPYQAVSIFEDITHQRHARVELERRVAERTAELDAARARLEHELAQRTLAEGELLRTNRLLRTLSSCNQVLVHAADEHDLLEQVTRALSDAGGYPMAAVVARDETGYSMVAHSVSGETGAFRAWLTDAEVTERIDSLRVDGRPDVWRGAKRVLGAPETLHTVVTVPMRADESLEGALIVVVGSQNSPEAEEIALLVELAGDLEYGLVALHTRRMQLAAEEGMATSYREVEAAMRNAVAAMARMAETRDPYTAGHQARVADLAYALARAMGYSDQDASIIWLAGSIHDIGKISVPAEILSKPGKLTPLEFSLVRGHSRAAQEILSEIDFPWPIEDIVLQHHERMDGSGYPDGIAGDDIMPEARILMVADVVEAVSSHRPYRESLGVKHALEIIRKGRGTLYDADVVDACLKLFGSGAFGFDRPGATKVDDAERRSPADVGRS